MKFWIEVKRAFGVFEGDFSREDKAAAWLQYFVIDLVQTLHYACIQSNVKRVFFSGGLAAHLLIRSKITTEFARRNLLQSIFCVRTKYLSITSITIFKHYNSYFMKAVESSR